MSENENKISLWIWLIPVYILLAIPLAKWTMKIYSPDVELSKEDLSAFSGEGKIKKENYKLIEPNLEDVAFAISYKNQGTSIDEEDPYQKIERKSKDVSYEVAKEENKGYAKKTDEERKKDQSKYDSNVDNAKQSQMMSMGYKQGFLTKTVSSLMSNPKAVKALFNNSYVIKGFLGRETVKSAMENSKSLESFLMKSEKVPNFLNNPVVKQAMGNSQIVGALASSGLVAEMLKMPAAQQLLSDKDAMKRILDSNPQFMQLLGNPNISQAIASNPQTATVLTNVPAGLPK